MLSPFTLPNASPRCLEETAVTTEDLMIFVACQAIKRGGSVDDGGVISPYVDYDKGAGHINGA
jgi:hypothetical protein